MFSPAVARGQRGFSGRGFASRYDGTAATPSPLHGVGVRAGVSTSQFREESVGFRPDKEPCSVKCFSCVKAPTTNRLALGCKEPTWRPRDLVTDQHDEKTTQQHSRAIAQGLLTVRRISKSLPSALPRKASKHRRLGLLIRERSFYLFLFLTEPTHPQPN